VLIPQRRVLIAALAWCLLGAAVAAAPAWITGWQVVGVLLLGVSVADAVLGTGAASRLACKREVHHTLPVGRWHDAVLEISASGTPGGHGASGASDPTLSGIVQEDVPPGMECEQGEQRFVVSARRTVRLSYRIRPLRRGTHRFGPASVRVDSPLGLWHIQRMVGQGENVRVYTDFGRIVQYELLAIDHRLSQMGVLQRRRRGEGAEFHQLRDYHQDDSPRQIDWKATSRMARLISREYEDERDQQIVIVLDCSQRMRAKDTDLSHFDHALNATLLLAYVALRQGDSVGLATFGHERPRFLAPRASLGTVPRLLNAAFDLQPSLQAPDYLGIAVALRRRLTRRALVVFATVVREEDAEALRRAAQLLMSHRLVVASLRESAMTEIREAPITTLDDAVAYAAATDYSSRRRRAMAALRHSGVSVLDTSPEGLSRQLVNHYWERKRAGAA
jgi:uncharacterized protein (DUF58 family)